MSTIPTNWRASLNFYIKVPHPALRADAQASSLCLEFLHFDSKKSSSWAARRRISRPHLLRPWFVCR